MKILQLRIKNINSFKEEHHVDFEKMPLATAGLIAITGVTGSGKSTLLDAITLALYNKTPRFPAVSKNSLIDTGGICTRNTRESYSEIEYLVQGKRYRSKWSIKLNRNNNLSDYHMELTCLTDDDKPMDIKRSIVPDKNTEIIGLSFDQFVKSILLSQGEFARLLKADPKERGHLLERITGTDVYRKLSKLTFERFKEERTIYEGKRDKLQGIELLTESSIFEKKRKIEELDDQLQLLDQERTDLEEKYRLRDDLSKRAQVIREQEVLLETIKEEQDDFEEERQRLEWHEKLSNEVNRFRHIERLQEDRLIKTNELNGVRGELNDLVIKVEEVRAKESKIINKLNAITDYAEVQKDIFKEVRELDQIIAVQTEKLKQEQEALAKEKKDLAQSEERLLKNKGDFFKVKNQEQEALQFLQKNELLNDVRQEISVIQYAYQEAQAGRKEIEQEFPLFQEKLKKELPIKNISSFQSVKELKTQLLQDTQALEQEIEQFNYSICNEEEIKEHEEYLVQQGTIFKKIQDVLQRQSQQFLKATEQIEVLESQLKRTQEKEISQKEVLQKKKDFIKIQSLKVDELTIKKERLQLEAKYEDDRKLLKSSEPCFLCGSIHHPYVENYEHSLSEVAEAFEQAQQELLTLQKEERDLSEEILQIEAQYNSYQQQLKQAIQNKKTAESLFKEACIELELSYEIFEEKSFWEKELKRIKDEGVELRTMINANHKRLVNLADQDVLFSFDKLLNNTLEDEQKFLRSIEKYQSILKGTSPENYESELDRLASVYQEKQDLLTDLEKEKALLEQQCVSDEDLIKEKTEQVAKTEEIYTTTFKYCTSQKELRYEKLGDKDPIKEEEQLQKDLEIQQIALQEIEKVLIQLQEKQKGKNTFETALQQEVLRLEESINSENDSLKEVLKKWGYGEDDDIQRFFLTEEEEQEIKKKDKAIQDRLMNCQQHILVLRKEFVELREQSDNTENRETLQEKIIERKQIIQQLHQELATLKNELKTDAENKEKHKELALEIQQQEKEFRRWDTLNNLIGSEKGDKFSKFAQELTFMHLVQLANRRLQELDSRYILKKYQGKEKEDVAVIDTYQGNTERSISTLSGGETFLVSLAMALGLSDMASRNVKIESLFIDEGFGTLDEETLDSALSTLENLQVQTNKTIAVISHIPSLKERIQTQIQMTKNSSGFSKMKVM